MALRVRHNIHYNTDNVRWFLILPTEAKFVQIVQAVQSLRSVQVVIGRFQRFQ
jgi:hypothetical protein